MKPTSGSRPRLLIFVIAYYAESTLRSVLDRIPRELMEEYDCEVCVVDDASEDRTSDIGHEYRRDHVELKIVVFRNHVNQGYGGNQKVGYTYAIENGFDYVAMVHGDGQYAPEELPRLVKPLRDDEADAVFGSRMLTRGGALAGGMPLYKFVGNKILTKFQNAVLGTSLSEFHSGYRIYRVATLKQLPFRTNSNDFHFDTEIILQLIDAKARVLELPIPTYYGDEISRVNGMKYAGNVAIATLRYAAHRSGILYRRRYDTDTRTGSEHYDLKLGYASSHTYALSAVKPSSTVLDLGAGPGGIAAELTKQGCEVTVVDQHAPTDLPQIGNVRVHAQDLDDPLELDVRPFDYVLMLDVIEHLKDPEKTIDQLRKQFDYEPRTLVLTTPNVAFLTMRLMLLAGQFNYGKHGILDRTHTRLFTFRSIRRLLEDAGFRIKKIEGVPAPIPKALGDNAVSRFLLTANLLAIRMSKALFSYQIFIEADATPDVDFVLGDTRARGRDAGTISG